MLDEDSDYSADNDLQMRPNKRIDDLPEDSLCGEKTYNLQDELDKGKKKSDKKDNAISKVDYNLKYNLKKGESNGKKVLKILSEGNIQCLLDRYNKKIPEIPNQEVKVTNEIKQYLDFYKMDMNKLSLDYRCIWNLQIIKDRIIIQLQQEYRNLQHERFQFQYLMTFQKGSKGYRLTNSSMDAYAKVTQIWNKSSFRLTDDLKI